jgi:hypothetical protein
MSNASNVISGPATLYVAPADGTVAIPPLTGAAADFALFDAPGYTDKGIEFDYASTDKDIDVDELTSPVDVLITAEKLTITVSIAETTLKNLYYAISGGTLGTGTPPTEITIGGKIRPSRFMLGLLGPAPSIGTTPKFTREILIYSTVPKGTVKLHYQRKDKLMYTAQFQALGISSQPIGSNLCIIQDF